MFAPMGCATSEYRGTSLITKRTPLGPNRRPMLRVLGWSCGGGRFLMSEVPLQSDGQLLGGVRVLYVL